MKWQRLARGFTLIEVLIALAIIAIACTAVVKAVSDSILVTTNIERRASAHWVAMNELANLQNGQASLPTNGSSMNGYDKMLGVTWYWVAESGQSGVAASISIVNIAVSMGPKKQAFYHLKGYVWISNNTGESHA